MARTCIDFRVLRHSFVHLTEKAVRCGFVQDLGLREHASAGAILAAGRHNPVGFGWSMPRARGGLSLYKRSWQNGKSVNFQARRYSKVPQKSGYQKKFALTGFSEGQLNRAPSVFLEKRVGVVEATSTPPQNGPKYVAYVALYGARVSVAACQVGQAPLL